jgi:hypothetical protein
LTTLGFPTIAVSMSEISVVELYELYLDTIGRCTSALLARSDEDILYELFEQFDIGAITFLHENTLAKLRAAGYIDDEAVAVAKLVRERWLDLSQRFWTVQDIRNREEWKELFRLCDRLESKSRNE